MDIRRFASVAALAVITCGVVTVPSAAAQPIDWHGCQTGPKDKTGAALDAEGARCAELTVPLNYAKPGGRTISLAIARRAATDTAHRKGTLLLNGGGPGPSLDAVTTVTEGAPALAAQYDLVGMDPRFFGRSSALECGWPTGLYLRNVQVASPNRAAFTRSTTAAKELAAGCAPYRDELPYASTRNMARDMDMVRSALGERQLSYLGWSSGTYLGAVYAQLFPTRTDRMVLDSSIDPNVAGPAEGRDLGAAAAAGLADLASWAARHNDTYGLGATQAAVLHTVDQTIKTARQSPMRIAGYQVTGDMMPGLLLTVVDTDAAYGELSARIRMLHDAALGRVVTPDSDQRKFLALFTDKRVRPKYGFSATVANKCADRAASRDPESYYRDIQAHRTSEPLFGPLFRGTTPCAFWPTAPAEPPTTIANDHPALLLGTTGDPSTPYPGQLAMHRAMAGSRMVTLAGAFRHTIYLGEANPCVDRSVTNYLLGGTLPAADLTCTRT